MRSRLRRLVWLVLALGAATPSVGQDSHHWTDQFGNRARLLGGAVIGSSDDLSSLFYNPGALALVENTELLLAGSVVQFTSFRLRNVDRPELDSEQRTARLSPSLFAGEIGGGADSDHRFAYSILTKVGTKFRVDERATVSAEGVPGLDFGGLDTRIELDLSEYWFGGTYARALGESTGVGVSTFLAVRNQRAGGSLFAQGLDDAGFSTVSVQGREYSYQHWRLLWKLGYSTVLEKWKVGLSLTTPGFGLGGQGTVGFDRTFVAQGVDDQGRPLSSIASDLQESSADFRSPLSIGAGAARSFGNTRVHVSAEWFDHIDPYSLLDTEPFEGQTSGELIDTDVVYGLESVVNVGFGLEVDVNEDLGVYGSFRTDRSGFDEAQETNASLTTYDIYHVAGGATFAVDGQDFTLGGVYAFGSSLRRPDFVVPGGAGGPPLDVRYTRLTFILGINFAFGP